MLLRRTWWLPLLTLAACAVVPDGAVVTLTSGKKAAAPAPAAATSSLAGTVLAPSGMTASATNQLISNDGGSIISQDGASLITNDGAGLISQDGASAVKRYLQAIATRPLAAATVLVVDANKKLVARTTTDAKGHYELKGLPRGVCLVQVSVKTADGHPGVLATVADTAKAASADVDLATTMAAVIAVRTRPLAGLDLETFHTNANAILQKLVDVPDVAHPDAMVKQADAMMVNLPTPTPAPTATTTTTSTPTATPAPQATPTATPSPTLPILAGTNAAGSADGPGMQAAFNAPGALALGPQGRYLFVSDDGNQVVRRIDLDDITAPVTTIRPGGLGFPLQLATGPDALIGSDASHHALFRLSQEGAAVKVDAILDDPRGLAFTAEGDVLVADGRGHQLTVVSKSNAFKPTVVAGSGTAGAADGKGSDAALNLPGAIATMGDAFYVACAGDGRVVLAKAAGSAADPYLITTFASGFAQPAALAVVDGLGLVVADTGHDRLQLASPARTLATQLSHPGGLAWDPNRRRLYVADTGHHTIRYLSL
ncbi:MAG: hypothetical protein JWM80_6359 [Cyanobacteria bacterium RYN_339]|nr:hypothetical protein [Cyanobacteria bacterium RYN_339]